VAEESVQIFSNLVKEIIRAETEVDRNVVQQAMQNALYSIEDYKRFAREISDEEKKQYKKKFEELETRFYILDHELVHSIRKQESDT
jgi:hypothetical protein